MLRLILLLTLASTSLYSAEPKSMIQPDNQLTVLGVIIGKTTLNEVKDKFKAKEIYHEGDAGNSLYALCFKGPGGSTIAFESGEMGGNERVVSSVSVNSAQAPYKLKQICEKTNLIKSKIAINGISLGMSPDLVKKLVGSPTMQDTNTIEFKYAIQEKTELGQKDITSSMTVEFKDSMSNKILVSKMESL